MTELGGRTAVVTGAAGGIGVEIARALALRGLAVAAVDNDADQLRDSVEKLRGEDLRVHGFTADVTSGAEVEAVVDRIEQELGPIDYLVNAAGVLRVGQVTELSEEDWTRTFQVNTNGVFLTSRAVARRMVPRRTGAIVTVASNSASTARVGMGAYAASKAASTMFTKCLGLEVARYGIRCNLVAPGSTDTPMLRALWNGGDATATSIEGKLDAYRVGIPLRKLARPADVANAVLFLLSDQAAHVTMHDLTVDGGATLGV
ncbi:2,3-dihydro-2,3-dihydroxybenzoate dehydrogenase [Lentzea sp. NEAU-D7]|uniref:2,3-dihydro-2,3-dihydroxybenzoate dehydrogenase n=1 Tax=Lentzea sp. NEAU-D7 TaxID=2994667 RepID=UPI00224A70E2|nr:2,3-dihydro-2,3-dihydroxybenzoate dehydrogenase [Lentzea sp. NEAU-D7]MCX2953927.1 2,3-dihydro-2,3-dihydroxybenzoate dehydrogenase [Lentzea sp. NEAU-D7]